MLIVCEIGMNCKIEMIRGKILYLINNDFLEFFDFLCLIKDLNLVSIVDDRQLFIGVKRDIGNDKIVRLRIVFDLINICIDFKESDYLYVVGYIIYKVLDCEVNGNYEEVFSLYKICVGVLLSGV